MMARFPESPKGFRPPAQGWRACEPTLGYALLFVTTPTGLRPPPPADSPQPRWG